jgi:Ca-activated chloride channel family protein
VQAEFYPDPLPDLYAGEPVVFTARLPSGALPAGATATISGKRAGQAWRETLALDTGADSAGVGALWARSKLERLSETQKEGESADTVRAASLEVALGYGLVSRYTSLVAVDVTPARPANTDLHSTQVPTNLPDGMVHDAIFGERSKMLPGSAPGQLPTGLPPVRHAMAAPSATVGGALTAQQVALPQGATAAELHALIGLALLMLAGVLALIMRNRRV